MKKILLMLFWATLLLSSCVTVKPPLPDAYYTYTDYSILKNKGIFVTVSESVSFEYNPIGYISAVGVRGAVDKEIWQQKKGDNDFVVAIQGGFGDNANATSYQYISPDVNGVLEGLGEIIQDKGGNGIIGLKISFDYSPDYSKYSLLPKTVVSQIRVSGMIIKK